MKTEYSLSHLFQKGDLWLGKSRASSTSQTLSSVPFGIPVIDSLFPQRGLLWGTLHEWVYNDTFCLSKKNIYYPPFSLLFGLIHNALLLSNTEGKFVAFVGKSCFPTPYALQNILVQNNPSPVEVLFFSPTTPQQHLWILTELFRCPHVVTVVTTAHRLNFTQTRRLQLAIQEGNGLGFLIRSPHEKETPSAAHTKWSVSPISGKEDTFAWNVTLLRARGVPTPQKWAISWNEKLVLCEWNNKVTKQTEVTRSLYL